MADKWEWEQELGKAQLRQKDVAQHLGLSKQSMSFLVKKMIQGKGLTANDKDEQRWNLALEYIAFKQEQVKKGK
ncbi:hypothetical protein C6P26_07945 [Weissella confusa]|uniref:MarR family transcriptional regulator n=1 Tax=Weissella confusa TaxID=1583 RepID=UPI0010816860|nr:helix-turn-helix domain-containing protein [Weissella confusa]MBJ7635355.1 MarR family transcriptional regulator [Weissella confusa]TGE42749.1 hypothetical protein C6P26_07945 [Weissella confusa]